jgi:hypothetical protein
MDFTKLTNSDAFREEEAEKARQKREEEDAMKKANNKLTETEQLVHAVVTVSRESRVSTYNIMYFRAVDYCACMCGPR